MSRSIPNITGGLVRGRQGRAMAAAMRDMQNAGALDIGDIISSPQHGRFLGRIVAKGPNGEANFTDARYWVQPGNIQGGKVSDPIDFKDNKNFKPSIFPVTNLPEWKTGTHQIGLGEAVSFWLAWDRGKPNRPHWVMSESVAAAVITPLVKYVGSSTRSGLVLVNECAPLAFPFTVTGGAGISLADVGTDGGLTWASGAYAIDLKQLNGGGALSVGDLGKVFNARFAGRWQISAGPPATYGNVYTIQP